MDRVKKLIEAGASIPTAIKEALGVPLTHFADKAGLSLTEVSAAISGSKRASDRIIVALVAELGGTEPEWRELLWLAGKPESAASA